MPRDSTFVLARDNPGEANPEVVIRWRDQGLDKIGIMKRGAREPQSDRLRQGHR
jgi:hypothetical protein